ncbi:dTDP-4-dehydrorhamnose 3,5-epimerase [Isosphaera pallida ATCC 43644]|jgi:dTDP-4-dehydrorhamnose 3,5-epimerase|uniref:dTDP-4-dehydrorhamnose 3,5-epimerase n=1 Tax=Isosphaera pallida (strain ATCC 43644 / DSM 9630 / IS1B) TaxID=575540 RepID=E8QY47_ISOPI|nr:dTDP-4-dehydrorhamnose 3,5-epimerase [Isosphaera pallida]ADV62037.1 dTDP-4-dehydrorhamnose 3,5-epimerase [Isosphaera pallida ATCC 43644]
MNVEPTALPEVLRITPRVFYDDRGRFQELWNHERYAQAGLPVCFVQDNLSWSRPGVLRGLHFQNPAAQGKLVMVLSGAIFDVAVDVRIGSPTYGQWVGEHLSSENSLQLFIPQGFAHGFAVLGDQPALVAYKCTHPYRPDCERALVWNDADLAIAWPDEVVEPILNPKDRAASTLRQLERSPGALPQYDASPVRQVRSA